jgi:hypothetical protein
LGDNLYPLPGISLRRNIGFVDIDWPEEFGRWLGQLEEELSENERSRLIQTSAARALGELRNLGGPPA